MAGKTDKKEDMQPIEKKQAAVQNNNNDIDTNPNLTKTPTPDGPVTRGAERKAAFNARVQNVVDKMVRDIQPTEKKKDNFSYAVNKPDNWGSMGPDERAAWSETHKQEVPEYFANKYEENNQNIKPIDQALPSIDKEKLTELERKKQKGRWKNILIGTLNGLAGKDYNPSILPTNIYSAKQQALLQPYKEAVAANKNSYDKWMNMLYAQRNKTLDKAWENDNAHYISPEDKALKEAQADYYNRGHVETPADRAKKIADAKNKESLASNRGKNKSTKINENQYVWDTGSSKTTYKIPKERADQLADVQKGERDIKALRDLMQTKELDKYRDINNVKIPWYLFGWGKDEEKKKIGEKYKVTNEDLQKALDLLVSDTDTKRSNMLKGLKSDITSSSESSTESQSSSKTTPSESNNTNNPTSTPDYLKVAQENQ